MINGIIKLPIFVTLHSFWAISVPIKLRGFHMSPPLKAARWGQMKIEWCLCTKCCGKLLGEFVYIVIFEAGSWDVRRIVMVLLWKNLILSSAYWYFAILVKCLNPNLLRKSICNSPFRRHMLQIKHAICFSVIYWYLNLGRTNANVTINYRSYMSLSLKKNNQTLKIFELHNTPLAAFYDY